jgi:predicted nucleotidyltransferase
MDHDAAHPRGNASSDGNAMIALVDEKKPEIVALCKRFGIRSLDLFGSAATGTFDPAHSDLDFVVDLGPYDDAIADRYLDFAEALEALFGRSVDLVTEKSIRNPYLRYQVDTQKVRIYADGDSQAAA